MSALPSKMEIKNSNIVIFLLIISNFHHDHSRYLVISASPVPLIHHRFVTCEPVTVILCVWMYQCSPLWRSSLLRMKIPFSVDLGVTSSWYETLNPPAAMLYNERVAADWQLGKANLDWITLWSCFLCGNSNNTQQQIKMDNTIPKFNETASLKSAVWLGPFWLCVLKLIWIWVTFRVTLSALYNYVRVNRVCAFCL